MTDAYICDAIRTPIGRYGGALATVRTDDLAAVPLRALVQRNPGVDWAAADDLIFGCANQAGEDNRNVARMAALLAGLPKEVGGVTPVSYTHLDVYKRQIQGRSTSSSCADRAPWSRSSRRR